MVDECNPSSERAGKVAPVIDRERCEGKADCVRVCPFGVFRIEVLSRQQRSALTWRGRLKAWAHGGRQALVIKAEDCHACQLCVSACPEQAIRLAPLGIRKTND
ncbi:MAG TPA: ferredoxin family protein [Lautropia sp.]|jgi:NAD-dependent dihydropyrimidine dehydrogenase PreA subunit|nr:ferredoxin family protein [Lautropia sp.]